MVLFGQFLDIWKLAHPLVNELPRHHGASSSHSGIDIPAPEGTALLAVADGIITFTQFLGAGGYTITLSFQNYKVSYCHCSPNYIVSVGQYIKQGEIIGYVGPKYVYNVLGNQYKDSTGKPTNGASTGTHLHWGIRIDDKYQNPINFFSIWLILFF